MPGSAALRGWPGTGRGALAAFGAVLLLTVSLTAQRPSYERLSWATLAGVDDVAAVDPNEGGQGVSRVALPERLAALNGRHVLVEGVLTPIGSAGDWGSLFALTPVPTGFAVAPAIEACTPGLPARPTDWILVRMSPGTRPLVSHLPTTVRGRLAVGWETHDGGLVSIYRIDAQSVVPRGVLGW